MIIAGAKVHYAICHRRRRLDGILGLEIPQLLTAVYIMCVQPAVVGGELDYTVDNCRRGLNPATRLVFPAFGAGGCIQSVELGVP